MKIFTIKCHTFETFKDAVDFAKKHIGAHDMEISITLYFMDVICKERKYRSSFMRYPSGVVGCGDVFLAK